MNAAPGGKLLGKKNKNAFPLFLSLSTQRHAKRKQGFDPELEAAIISADSPLQGATGTKMHSHVMDLKGLFKVTMYIPL